LLLQDCVYHKIVMYKKSPGTLVSDAQQHESLLALAGVRVPDSVMDKKSPGTVVAQLHLFNNFSNRTLSLPALAGVRVPQGSDGQEEPRHAGAAGQAGRRHVQQHMKHTQSSACILLLLQECVYHKAVMDKKSPGTLAAHFSVMHSITCSTPRNLFALLALAGVRVPHGSRGQEEPRHTVVQFQRHTLTYVLARCCTVQECVYHKAVTDKKSRGTLVEQSQHCTVT
jgi:hypothetical protein